MKLQTGSLTRETIPKELESKLRRDFTFKSGRRIGSMRAELHATIVGLKSDAFNICQIAHGLRLRWWDVLLFPNYMRIVVMPHVRKRHIKSFVKDLKFVTEELEGGKCE